MEDRIKLLEEKIQHHHRQISKLFSEIDETKANIQKIMNILTQIRYFLGVNYVWNTNGRYNYAR